MMIFLFLICSALTEAKKNKKLKILASGTIIFAGGILIYHFTKPNTNEKPNLDPTNGQPKNSTPSPIPKVKYKFINPEYKLKYTESIGKLLQISWRIEQQMRITKDEKLNELNFVISAILNSELNNFKQLYVTENTKKCGKFYVETFFNLLSNKNRNLKEIKEIILKDKPALIYAFLKSTSISLKDFYYDVFDISQYFKENQHLRIPVSDEKLSSDFITITKEKYQKILYPNIEKQNKSSDPPVSIKPNNTDDKNSNFNKQILYVKQEKKHDPIERSLEETIQKCGNEDHWFYNKIYYWSEEQIEKIEDSINKATTLEEIEKLHEQCFKIFKIELQKKIKYEWQKISTFYPFKEKVKNFTLPNESLSNMNPMTKHVYELDQIQEQLATINNFPNLKQQILTNQKINHEQIMQSIFYLEDNEEKQKFLYLLHPVALVEFYTQTLMLQYILLNPDTELTNEYSTYLTKTPSPSIKKCILKE